MGNAEALLLVDDEKSQVPELNIFREQPVRSYDDIDEPFLKILDRLFDLCGRTETAQKLNAHRKILHALQECPVMLLGKDRRRHEIGHLLAVHHGLKGCAECNLSLPVADIPADQPVHDLPAFHIPLGVLDRLQLVLRLLVGEELLELALPLGVGAVDKSVLRLPLGIQRDEIFRDIFDGSPDPGLCFCPVLPAQLIELQSGTLRAGIFLQHIELGGQYIEISVLILELYVVLHDIVDTDLLDSLIDRKPSVLMDHIIADVQFRKARDLLSAVPCPLFPLSLLLFAENIRLGNDREADQRILESAARMAVEDDDLPLLHLVILIFRVKCRHIEPRKILRKTLRPRARTGQNDHPVPSFPVF